jgi:hypothetical protein
VRDTVNMVRQGIPSVGLVHEPFQKLARMQCVQLGMPDAPILIYPQDLPSKDPPELVARKAQEVAERATDMLLGAATRVAIPAR